MTIERICDGNQLIAMIVRKDAPLRGNNFFSDDDAPLQFGVNVYGAGEECRPHVHVSRVMQISETQEILYLISGSAELSLFTKKGDRLFVTRLMSGDGVYLASGGHGLKMLEPTKTFVVKQGPFRGTVQDKSFL